MSSNEITFLFVLLFGLTTSGMEDRNQGEKQDNSPPNSQYNPEAENDAVRQFSQGHLPQATSWENSNIVALRSLALVNRDCHNIVHDTSMLNSFRERIRQLLETNPEAFRRCVRQLFEGLQPRQITELLLNVLEQEGVADLPPYQAALHGQQAYSENTAVSPEPPTAIGQERTDNENWRPIVAAADYDRHIDELGESNPEIISLLISQSANRNVQDRYSSRSWHAWECPMDTVPVGDLDHDIVRLLPESTRGQSGPKIADLLNLKKSLLLAINRGDKGEVAKIVARGVNVNSRYKQGSTTPLIAAIQHGNLEIIKFLLDNRADVNRREKKFGWTPLMMAVKKNNLKAVELLLSYEADVFAVNKAGQTAAVMASSSEMLAFLWMFIDLLKPNQIQRS